MSVEILFPRAKQSRTTHVRYSKLPHHLKPTNVLISVLLQPHFSYKKLLNPSIFYCKKYIYDNNFIMGGG